MPGESNLSVLLRTMRPVLHESVFGYFSLSEEKALSLIPHSWGFFRETEGITLILDADVARQHGLECESRWALITLSVHSSLSAVGFLAAISSALAAAGISLNAISAYYHDHLFVPWGQRSQAMEVLKEMAKVEAGDLHP